MEIMPALARRRAHREGSGGDLHQRERDIAGQPDRDRPDVRRRRGDGGPRGRRRQQGFGGQGVLIVARIGVIDICLGVRAVEEFLKVGVAASIKVLDRQGRIRLSMRDVDAA